MKSEFVESLIPETVEGRAEIVRKIVEQSGKDITNAKKDYADYDAIKDERDKAKAAIVELEKSKGDAGKLQEQIDAYKKADAERVEAENKAKARAEVTARFEATVGERKFAHDYIKNGVLTEFEAALVSPDYKGKGDKDIFDAITKDKDGLFASMNPNLNMGGVGDVGSKTAITPEQWKGMGISARTELKTKDPKQYEILAKGAN